MKDYEDLYRQTLSVEKELKDKISSQQKLFKSISKNMEKGDLKSWTRDLASMRGYLKEQESFIKELAAAYDLMLLKQNQGKTPTSAAGDIYLRSLYTLLTPMRRLRKDYDMQSFAFDLARLYTADLHTSEDGRKFQFGPSRNINKAIRILDKDGREQYLATICFYEPVASELDFG